MSFAETLTRSRRVFLLRLLVEIDGNGNESVLRSAARSGGFASATADDIRADLDHLHRLGCVTETWMGQIRVVTLTERGEDAAYGRVEIDGVEHSHWRRG